MFPRTSTCFTTLLLLAPAAAFAQPTPGLPPFGSFSGGPFDTINNANLNVHFEIPIVSKAGRGMPFSYNLTYDSSVWSPVSATGASAWTPLTNWGWGNVTQASQSVVGHLTYQSHQTSCPYPPYPPPPVYYYWNYYDNFAYVDPAGTSHSITGLSVSDWGGRGYLCGGGAPTPATKATDDGSYTVTVNTSSTTTPYTVAAVNTQGISAGLPLGLSGPATETDSNGNQITTAYSNGVTTVTDTLATAALTVSGSGTQSSPMVFAYQNPQGTTSPYTVKYTPMTVQTAFGCSGILDYGPTSGISLVTSVVLPDQTQYTIQYEPTIQGSQNVTGRIYSITLPTGGTITYTYSGGSHGIMCSDGSTAGLSRATPDGTWPYARTVPAYPNPWSTTITDPNSKVTSLSFQGTQNGVALVNAIYEVQRIVSLGSQGTLTVSKCYNGTASSCTTTPVYAPITQVATTRTLPSSTTSSVQSKTLSLYNTYGLPTEADEYDYGASAANPAAGGLTRKTTTSYAFSGGPANRPGQVTVYNGFGTMVAQTTYGYDQTAVTATSGTLQHVAASGARGNATTISRWVAGSATLNQTFTYFDTGNVYTSTDANGAVTTFTYGACSNSFVTFTALPLSLTAGAAWNCAGGVQTAAWDANGQAPPSLLNTQTSYADANFWRPTKVVDPSGATTNITYTGSTLSESALNFATSSTVDTLTTLDGLGRTSVSQKRQAQGSSSYDSVETDYDSMGRPSKVTIPYTATSIGATAPANTSATYTTYDALNRPLQVTDSGNGTTTYTYNQNDVLVSVGAPTAQRQLEYDALGRLTSVCEISSTLPGRGACGQNVSQTGFLTRYAHDALGNLATVAQNAQAGAATTQSRAYYFDGLGRMTSEYNPETAPNTIRYYYDTDGTCGTSNGDMVKRTDALYPSTNVTCYAYDALHRVTAITYPSGSYSGVTPQKHFVYDAATLSNGSVMANAKGRLAEAYTGAAKTTDLGFSYSNRGEIADTYQLSPNSGGFLHLTAAYWANGLMNVLNVHLPGVPKWTYSPDGEGRLSTVTAQTGQNPAPAQGSSAYNTTYNVFGLPNGVTFGSGDSDAFTYDAKTGRLTNYQAALGVLPSASLTVTGPQSGTSYYQTDIFTVNVKGAANQTVYVCQNNCGTKFAIGTTDANGNWSTSGAWGAQYVGAYTQVWSVGNTAATPTLNFSVVSSTPTPAGPTTSVLGPSSSGTLTWNANGSLAQLDALDGFNSASAQNFGNSQSCAYTHDDLGRLSAVDCGTGKWGQNFTYGSDNFGNVNWSPLAQHLGTQFLSVYDSGSNHFSSTNSPQPTYDFNGNLTYDGAHGYSWDAEGNLYQMATTAQPTMTMVYDALNRRVEQSNGSATTGILYAPDGSKLALMTGQTVNKAFVPLPAGATAVYSGSPLALAWYRHPDWLGSSRIASDATSRSVHYDGAYSPLGEIIGETGTTDRNFTGQNQDMATDSYDFMYRQYRAQSGRWISPDPAGTASVNPANPRSWNRYAYVNNGPLTNIDPDGQGILGDIFGTILNAVRFLMGAPGPLSPNGLDVNQPWSEQVPGLSPGRPLGGSGVPGGIWGSGQVGGGLIFSDMMTSAPPPLLDATTLLDWSWLLKDVIEIPGLVFRVEGTAQAPCAAGETRMPNGTCDKPFPGGQELANGIAKGAGPAASPCFWVEWTGAAALAGGAPAAWVNREAAFDLAKGAAIKLAASQIRKAGLNPKPGVLTALGAGWNWFNKSCVP